MREMGNAFVVRRVHREINTLDVSTPKLANVLAQPIIRFAIQFTCMEHAVRSKHAICIPIQDSKSHNLMFRWVKFNSAMRNELSDSALDSAALIVNSFDHYL